MKSDLIRVLQASSSGGGLKQKSVFKQRIIQQQRESPSLQKILKKRHSALKSTFLTTCLVLATFSCQASARSLFDSYRVPNLPFQRESAILDNTEVFDQNRKQSTLAQVLSSPWFHNLFVASVDKSAIDKQNERTRSVDQAADTPSEQKTHPLLGVPTLPEAEINEPWYDTIEIGYAWLAGYRPDLYWKNTTACFDRLTNYTYHEVPALQLILDNSLIEDYDKTEATLYVVRNFSEHMWYCNSVIQTSSVYWNERLKEFDSFGHFLLSMLQNFLGNVISLSNIYLSIEENLVLNNTYAMHYDIARIVRILTIFEPVELKDPDDFEYGGNSPPGNSGTGSGSGSGNNDAIPDPDVNSQQDPFSGDTSGYRPRVRNEHYGMLFSTVDDLFRRQEKRALEAGTNTTTSNSQLQAHGPRVGAPTNPFTALDDKTKGALDDLLNFEGITKMALGFLNATQVTYGGSRTDCQLAGEALLYSARRGYTIMEARWFNWFDFWYAMDYYIWVTYELYTIQHACTSSWNELKVLFQDYRAIASDFDIFWFNILYNGGLVMKGTVNLMFYFAAQEYTRVKDSFSFGMELGQIFWLLFYPVEEYLRKALEAGAEWGQDYTWDQVINMEQPGAKDKTVPVIGSYAPSSGQT